MLLNISIPTFNRAIRLKRALEEIFHLIIKDNLINLVSVYVSDNGSTDDTINIIKAAQSKFKENNIILNFSSNSINLGFDSNVKNCFMANEADYCWFVSDDDNLDCNILKNIIADINLFNPNIIFYNFDQPPYGKSSPLILQNEYHEPSGTDFGFSNFIKFPKLTSLVVKRTHTELQVSVLNFDDVKECAFSHIALALQTAFYCGKILLSKEFSASPDKNYRDHIDFPPYVGNKANAMLADLFKRMERSEWIHLHTGEHVDVAISSLEWLTDYYKGKAVVSNHLKFILIKDLKNEILEKKLFLILKPKFIRRYLYYIFAVFNDYFLRKIFKKNRILNAAIFH